MLEQMVFKIRSVQYINKRRPTTEPCGTEHGM